MNYEDIITTIMASITLLAFIGLGIFVFIKYGFKQFELDIKCRKAQIEFYKTAKQLMDKDLAENDGNKLPN